ncbi:MAG: hypothetical protein HY305_07725, partial [Sphingobacteriales bacterium]|nr:hypothetical protein [Sphingobacteriales bacterium]
LQSQVYANKKILSLQSNEIEATVTGKFKIMELPDAFKVFLNHYYPSYIKKPGYAMHDQNFSFFIKTKEVDNYIQLLDKKLKGFDNSLISGNLNLNENELNINADIPLFSYAGKTFSTTKLTSHGNQDTLVAKIDVEDIAINDSLHLPATNLVFSSHSDISTISLRTRASEALSDASLNAEIQTMSEKVKIHFFPSSFIINDKKWQLEKDGELTIGTSTISANDIKFTQGNQQITILTEPSEILNSNDILIGLKKVSINEVAPYLFKHPRLEGILTGNIKIADPFGNPFIQYTAQAEEVRIDADSIGIINSTGTYASSTGIVQFKADANNEKYQFTVDGSFNSQDSTANQTSIAFKTNKFKLSILNKYLDDIFSNIDGVANTSDLKISGNKKHLLLTGSSIV